jgi:hypothetical protein
MGTPGLQMMAGSCDGPVGVNASVSDARRAIYTEDMHCM